MNAGSSAGSEDYTAQVVSEVGRLLVHGIAVRPGHPVVLGVAGSTPLIGAPGYPVSCVLTMDIIVKPLISRLLGVLPPVRPRLEATMSRKVLSPMGEDEFMRVKVGRVGERVIATPLTRGAGVIMSLVRADGLVRIPRFSEGLEAGSTVEVELLRPREEVENTIVAIGSHDMTLDLLGSLLHKDNAALSLASANVGSLGGLQALRREEAHLAGTHLLDEDTGEYNIPYIRRVLGDSEVVVVNLTYRDQGLIVPKGNPENIRTLSDLSREDVSFVNRQRGFRDAAAPGLRAKAGGHLRRKHQGLRPGRVHPYGRGRGRGQRNSFGWARHPGSREGAGSGLRAIAERALRSGDTQALLREPAIAASSCRSFAALNSRNR